MILSSLSKNVKSSKVVLGACAPSEVFFQIILHMILLFSVHYLSYLNKSSQRVLMVVANSTANQWAIDKFFTNL